MNRSQNILMLGLSLTGIVASSIKHDDNEFNDEHDELCHYFCLNTIFCSGSTAATILVESSRISLRCYSADFIVGRIYLVCGLFERFSCLFWAINTRHIYEAYHTWKMFAPIPSHSIAGLGRMKKEEFVYFINLFLSACLWSLFRWIISCARPLQNNNFSICITRWCLWCAMREAWIEKRAKALIICLWILFSGGFRRRRRGILIMLRKSIMDHYYYGVPLNEIESESTRGREE